MIATCFEQNFICHESLKNADASTQNDWTYFIGVFVLGAIGGIVFDAQMHK